MNSPAARPALAPTWLVLLSIASTQLGSAVAKSLFPVLNPIGIVFLRVGFAAIVLLLLWRPRLQTLARDHYLPLLLFGLTLSMMNLSFYLAIDRIPIGVAVALEFLGPLAVAVVNSHRWLDLLWVGLAGLGIVLLAPIGGQTFDPMGIALSFVAAGLWGTYILLSAKVGQILAGGSGLALAMGIGAIVLLPFGLVSSGMALLNPYLLVLGFGVAMLSSALPYSLELEALRWLPVSVFGVLLSLEPMVAALLGFLILGETLELRAVIAIGLVTLAAAGASRFSSRRQNVN